MPSSRHASATMRANRGRDTGPEKAIRSRLHALGGRYRTNLRLDLPGGRVRPDIVFTKRRVAVFVDGCFWHGCPQHAEWPASNAEFWRLKIERNRDRDRTQTTLLRSAGWRVVRIWEHEDPDAAVSRILRALREESQAARRA